MPEVRKELRIERAGLMGQGVAYDEEGNIYFVPGAVPGDHVEVLVQKTEKKYRDAKLLRVVSPSSDRRFPGCRHFPECGGCDWLHLDYQAQLKAKEEILRHVLERANLVPTRALPIIGAQQTEGYRNRIQVRRQGAKLGFLRKRSQALVDIDQCLIADPRLNDELARIRKEPAAARPAKIELYVREDGKVGRVIDRPHASLGFTQINIAQNRVLQSVVSGHVENSRARRVLELFCGNGNFTHRYSGLVTEIIGVDSSEAALREGRAHCRPTDESKILFLQSFVNRGVLQKLPPGFITHYDTLVLDPPRVGMGADLSVFIHSNLRTVIYISCSPVSFSQDVQPLKREFTFAEVQAVDMFPHTRHIEFVARFERVA